MKPKTDRQWTGSVYSQASGDTYYGTMAMKGSNTLRVEACALGRFYCSGNNWSRIAGQRRQPGDVAAGVGGAAFVSARNCHENARWSDHRARSFDWLQPGTGSLEHADHNGADEGECDVRGYNAQSADLWSWEYSLGSRRART